MAMPLEMAMRRAHNSEQLLRSALRSTFDESATPIETRKLFDTLADLRSACEPALLDFPGTSTLESTLWEAHTAVNSRFRDALRKIDRKSRPVEWRITAEQYKVFIKHSQIFYRQLVRSLDLKIGGLPGLHEAAQSWRQEAAIPARTEPEVQAIDETLRKCIKNSCHDSLMHLGDLSRWRHAEKLDLKANRSPKEAVGYYELAESILPWAAASQHQLGILAGNDGKAFQAIYHFYRALCNAKPHPHAQRNLELEFKKAIGWKTQDLIASCLPSDQNLAIATFKAWFIILHAKLYSGQEFPGRSELADEVISRLTTIVAISNNSVVTLRRMAQINIGAVSWSKKRLASEVTVKNSTAFSSLVGLNVRTFAVLLQQLETVLKEDLREDVQAEPPSADPAHISRLCQQVLPTVLLYALWLVSNWQDFQTLNDHPAIAAAIQDLWHSFAVLLTLLVKRFPLDTLPSIDYLLPEGGETLGFTPVQSSNTEDFWFEDGRIKNFYSNTSKTKEQNNLEDLARVKAIIACGVRIAVTEPGCPLVLNQEDSKFFYEDPNVPSELLETHCNMERNEFKAGMGAELPHAAPKSIATGDSAYHHDEYNITQPEEAFITPTMKTSAVPTSGGTIDMTEMVAHLTTEDEQYGGPDTSMPLTPPANSKGDPDERPTLPSTAVEVLSKHAFQSTRSSNAPPSRPQSGVPSPIVPDFQQFPLLPGVYGPDNIWQNKPSSSLASADDGWSSRKSNQQSPWDQSPLSQRIGHVSGGLAHSHRSSYPEYGEPSTYSTQQYLQQRRSSGDVTMTPPTIAAAHHSRHAFSGGLAWSMGNNLHFSSQLFDSSHPGSSRQVPSSWNRTPPNGQGG